MGIPLGNFGDPEDWHEFEHDFQQGSVAKSIAIRFLNASSTACALCAGVEIFVVEMRSRE